MGGFEKRFISAIGGVGGSGEGGEKGLVCSRIGEKLECG